MLSNLAMRDVDPEMFGRLCEICVKHLPVDHRNSSRIIAYILKTFEGKNSMPEPYKGLVTEVIIRQILSDLKTQLTTEIPEAGKQTVEGIIKKIVNYKRLLYTLNKHKTAAAVLQESSTDDITLPAGDLLIKMQKKEQLAIKMLSKEDL